MLTRRLFNASVNWPRLTASVALSPLPTLVILLLTISKPPLAVTTPENSGASAVLMLTVLSFWFRTMFLPASSVMVEPLVISFSEWLFACPLVPLVAAVTSLNDL